MKVFIYKAGWSVGPVVHGTLGLESETEIPLHACSFHSCWIRIATLNKSAY